MTSFEHGDVDPALPPPGPRSASVRLRRQWLSSPHFGPVEDLRLLPGRLCHAASSVLGIDGAGVSMLTDEMRVPLGASDPVAERAERLQFTAGEGPCLQASAENRIGWSDADAIARQWPVFADQLFARTPYRAVLSLPLTRDSKHFGALDVYAVDPDRLGQISIVDAVGVAEEIMRTLFALSASRVDQTTGDERPIWLNSPAATARLNVWVSIGMVIANQDLSSSDALDVLRARAYAQDTTIDDLSRRLASGEDSVDGVGGSGSTGEQTE